MDNIVYFLTDASDEQAREAAAAMEQTARELAPILAREVRFHVENVLPRALAKLRLHGADVLVVDARHEAPTEQSKAVQLLRELYREHEVAGPTSRSRTILVAPASPFGAQIAFEAGRLRIGSTLPLEAQDSGWARIWHHIDRAIHERRGGKTAICLAGGASKAGFTKSVSFVLCSIFCPTFPWLMSISFAASVWVPSSALFSPTGSVPMKSCAA
ncbi:MAG TPA: hypothetical protein PKK83_18790 [Polyangiaceae bacterium]|nr:hypothetical protein [Polyangiaceae bacterium]HQM10954.1 hypothetical protein [Polyangiaceae bacterium]